MGGDNRRGREEYRRFLRGGIGLETESPLEVGKGQGIIGKADFISQPEIGRLVGGIDYNAVSRGRRRLHSRREREPELRKRFDKLSDRLQQVPRGKT